VGRLQTKKYRAAVPAISLLRDWIDASALRCIAAFGERSPSSKNGHRRGSQSRES